MTDEKIPDFIKDMNSKLSDEQKDIFKNFYDNNPVKSYQPYGNKQNGNVGLPMDMAEQLDQGFKKKSFRDTALFYIAISSIVIAIASLIVSIMALKH